MNELKRFWKLPEEYNSIFIPYENKVANLLYERYQKRNYHKRLNLYYLVKPLMPRFLQIYLRKRRARTICRPFPNWPIDTALEDLKRSAIRKLDKLARIPFIWFWPEGKEFAFVITHDVETDKGMKNITKICEIEKKYGFRSSWNFVPERYWVSGSLVDELKNGGFEIGVHGLKHDGKLFSSKKIFDKRMRRIKEYAQKWAATGFRSPSLHRNPEWLRELPFEYDSSFPDTDPYGPQPGGCLSVFPYFIGNLLELPITLVQDHTLFEILGDKDISIWRRKVDWIEKINGMALVIVHPDYIINDTRLKWYEDLLQYVRKKTAAWLALPRDVNNWWRQRDGSSLKYDVTNNYYIDGPASNKGFVRYLELVDNDLNLNIILVEGNK